MRLFSRQHRNAYPLKEETVNQEHNKPSDILSSSAEIPLGAIPAEYEGRTIVFNVDVPQPVKVYSTGQVIREILESQNLPCPFCRALRKCSIFGATGDPLSSEQSTIDIAVLLKCAVCRKDFTAIGTLNLLRLENLNDMVAPSCFFENTFKLHIYPPVIIEGHDLLEEWRKSKVPERTCFLYSDACRAAEAGAIISAGGLMRVVAERTVKEHLGVPESKDTLFDLLKDERCNDIPEEYKDAIRNTCNDILHDNTEAHNLSKEHLDALKMLIEKMVDEWFVRPHKEKEAIKKLKSITDST